MKAYKLDSNFKNIKFHKWNIEIGSNVSKGTILFLFKKDGKHCDWMKMYMLIFFFLNLENSKYEKYRSNRGVLQLKACQI